ncbi:MAG TPA: sulfatase [Verrucomicrobiae bacterium]|nr:sulfatase [Verrucomicrobiae bacterium]
MNVIILCSDTFRYDHLGFVNRQQVVTPNLDQLARESACFSDFWLCSFPTLVNRIEVFSGRYTFPLMDWGALPFQFPVLAEVFKHHGFATALFTDNLHMMQDGFGFGRGFDVVKNVPGQLHDHFQPPSTPMIDLPCGAEKLEPKTNRLERYRRNAYWYRQHNTNPTETVFQEAMRWLDRPPGKFFLWLDTFDPHEPWDAPDRYLSQYPWNPAGEKIFWPCSGKAGRYSAADLENMRSLYKSEVSQTDFWIGQLLAHLRKNGLLEDTAVMFCSDHGYYFGEHGMLGKPLKNQLARPTTIYEELGHIPLLVRHPRGEGAGTTQTGLCQPPDLFATALDLAGIPKVGWAQGNSLVPRLAGRPGTQKFAVGGCHPHRGVVACLTVITDEWFLIYSPAQGLAGAELFHRPTDPTQIRDVIGQNRPVAEELFGLLVSWLEELNVPAARRQQLLYDADFGWAERMKHRFWLLRNRWSYQRNYADYARG